MSSSFSIVSGSFTLLLFETNSPKSKIFALVAQRGGEPECVGAMPLTFLGHCPVVKASLCPALTVEQRSLGVALRPPSFPGGAWVSCLCSFSGDSYKPVHSPESLQKFGRAWLSTSAEEGEVLSFEGGGSSPSASSVRTFLK